MLRTVSLVVLAAALGSACTTSGNGSATAQTPSGAATDPDFEKDRAAILAMAGNYEVSFHFEETVALAEGYALKEPKTTGGTEIIRVIEDTGEDISLQHILVAEHQGETMVIKHWRQDWVYEPERRLAYQGNNRWANVEIPAEEAQGAWSQSVYQVDDSPRYSGVGAWEHEDGVSTWESAWSWRPLPRRERTTRDDYEVMQCINRHTITPWGWAHEQDNEKLAFREDGHEILVREIGVNTYKASTSFDGTPAEEYWAETKDYWADVRAYWDEVEQNADQVAIDNPPALFRSMLRYAASVERGEVAEEAAVEKAQSTLRERVSLAPDQFAEVQGPAAR